MNETVLTVVGHVASDPQLRATASGAKVGGFRLASTERRYDKGLSAWRDGDTIFWAVSCWRAAAENVVDSLEKGQPVIVHGRLKERSYEDRDGVRRTSLEIDALTVGHDLTRGVAKFTKAAGTRREDIERELSTPAVTPDDDPALGSMSHDSQGSDSTAA
jgi:single-strand DNA-binding protein